VHAGWLLVKVPFPQCLTIQSKRIAYGCLIIFSHHARLLIAYLCTLLMALGMAKFFECCNQVRAQRDTIGACIADKLAHIVAVFLIYEGVVVLVIAAGAGEENLFVRAPVIDLFTLGIRSLCRNRW